MTIDADKIARLRQRLGKPPGEPSGNLSPPLNHEQPAPTTATVPAVIAKQVTEPRHEPAQPRQDTPVREGRGGGDGPRRKRRDIRTISATGRLVQFSSRITLELDYRIGEIIERRQDEINGAKRGPKYKYGICNFLEEAAFLFENIPTAEE